MQTDSEKQKPVQNLLSLVKNRKTPKTFNKDKKVVKGKEYPSRLITPYSPPTSSSSQHHLGIN